MRKSRIACVLAVVMALSCAGTAYADKLALKVDGLAQVPVQAPVVKDNVTLLSLQEICKFLGASFEWDKAKKTLTAVKGDTAMRMTEGKKEVYVNGKLKHFPVVPVTQDGTVMVPLAYVCDVFGAKVSQDSKGITITTGNDTLQMLPGKPAGGDVKVLTYQEALNRAISANNKLKNLEESAEYMEEARKDAIKSFDDAVTGLTVDVARYGNVDVTKMAITLTRTTAQLENQMVIVPLNEEIIRDSLEYVLRSTLSNMATYEMDIKMLEESMKLQSTNVNNLLLKESLGMASANEVKAARQSYEQSKPSLNLLKIRLEKEKNALRKLLDYDNEQELAVQYEPTVKPINVNIRGYASAKASVAPTIKIKQILMEDAKYMLDTTNEDMDESKLEKENSYSAAARDLYDAQRDLESAIRTAYSDIQSLEEQQKSYALELQKAKDDYNSMVANYEAGHVTMYEVDAMKLAILKAEISMSKNAYTYWNLAYGFEKPYLLVKE